MIVVTSESVLQAIGNTPLIGINNLNPYPEIRIFAKFEGCNPGGSVKDRIALYMILAAEQSGALTRDKIIMEPTSGNTGIALAMIGAAKGYHVKLVMPGCVSVERRRIIEAFGAEVVITPAEQGTDGAIRRAWQLSEENPEKYYMPDQFSNPANIQAHYETTGPEIYRELGGNIDCFVAGMGTTGTLMGVGTYLKERIPSIRIVGIEPEPGHAIQGLKNMDEAIVPSIYNKDLLDEKIRIGDEEAYTTARKIATREGIFTGMSSGAALAGAMKVAESYASGTIVTVFPDRGDRYLSTTLFRSICSDCNP
ncbi:MAG: cysteine synthase B [Methanoregulaceae archaeon PtaB.Bin108]|nr:MAG: cysteine synthase B [Methanoregulaceae archaeon PtaB.Bin108]OPY46419.1 MAG: cysteine synthase B [Methanoregulaceae archaeon PtaU1.Bin222]